MKKHILAICLSFFLTFSGKSQDLSFRHFTTDEGLSHNTVMSIYQDERGIIWFGTMNGINLFNGKEFKVYKHKKDDPNSLVYNDVRQITGDKNGTVYVITGNKGVSAYNIKQNTFTPLTREKVSAICYDEKLYIAYANNILEQDESEFKPFFQLPYDAVISVLCKQNDSLFIGTSNRGAFLLDPKGSLQHLIPTKEHIHDIFKDSSGDYWFTCGRGGGLYQLKEKELINHRHQENDQSTISSNFVHKCCEDKEGNIWVGTFNGLNKLDKKTNTFTRYRKTEGKKSLSESSIWSLLCDNQGTIWAGTYYGGVNYFNPQEQFYHEYYTSSREEEGLSSPVISRIIEDEKENLWICTEGGGVCKYNLQTRVFQWYKHQEGSNSISHNHVKSIYYDQLNKIVWIGTHLGGLNKLDLKTNQFIHYLPRENEEHSLPSNIILDILPYQNKLLLATHNGVTIFNPQDGKCERLFKDSDAFFQTQYSSGLTIDHHNTLWIVSLGKGISKYDFNTQKFTIYQYDPENPNSMSSDYVNSVYEDSQGRIWICTNEHGLDLYRSQTDDFANFDMQKNGLSSNVIYNICELTPERLLITTDNGYSILDYQKKAFTNYDKTERFPLTAINQNSLYKASTGEIFIGGVNGMVSFQEEDVKQPSRPYSVFPYRLIVNDKEIKVGDESGILTQDLTTTQRITLKAEHAIFSIEYAITDYLPFDKEDIIYQLEGFSDGWTSTRGKDAITYTNLNPGKYTLVVKSANSTNLLVPESRLEIEVLPPFYRTIWAYLIYMVCTIVLVYYLIRAYNNHIKLQESLKYEKRYAEDTEKLNQAKLRFFTNISHEFRTPLTLITGQVEMLLQNHSLGTDIYNPILKMYKNCIHLKELITELLDFRKQEQGYMTIKVSEHNIVDFLYEHYLSFQEYAAKRQVTFRFIKTNDDIRVWYDTKQLQKVMNNLISNAFKHTSQGGKVTVSVRKRKQEVIIEVTDNGVGISPKDIEHIFNRFYQTEQMESHSYVGTGIGLSLSKGIVDLHHGTIEVYSEQGMETTFSVHLRTGNEHFKTEEINNQPENMNRLVIENQSPDIKESETEEVTLYESSGLKSKKCKILIVEDNESLLEMLADLFKPFYKVITASNGEEGLEIVKAEQPNIVLSDIVMPKMSGIELCKAIKESMDTCHIPVVLLTAKTTLEHNIEGLKTGADDYITKPFNINLLLSRCNNLVNNRIMLQEKFCNQPQSTHRILASNTMDKEFIDKAIKVIEQHIGNVDFSMELFAREMCISRTKLFTKIKAITNQTPAECILTIRLKKAAILLKNNPEFNITEIADKLGFSSAKYFRKCFKERYNMAPQDYRKGDIEIREEEDTLEE